MTTTPSSNFAAWLREGLRAAFFMRPRWGALRATPGVLFALLLALVVVEVVAHRLYVEGEARFYWPALLAGWFPTVVTFLACWWLAPRAPAAQTVDAARAPNGVALFVLAIAQGLALALVIALVTVPLLRGGALSNTAWAGWSAWLAWVLPLLWWVTAAGALLWRSGHGPRATRAIAALAVAAATGLATLNDPMQLWYPQRDDSATVPRMQWTPALLEAQAATLPRRIDALAAQRPGVIDLYALTYAPYADEDVFLRESKMVAAVIEERFDAAGRSLMLANHRSTAAELPWATPVNLQRAIAAVAARMDPAEDVLFIHLTSHGARSGQLATAFWPIDVDTLTPAALKAALDAAGVRFRVISVSACYSGSWIAPLADDNTLVMTAADADHTSFGCGRGSELTYYGRAVFDEALRRDTRSFEAALQSAREVIRRREVEAGKDDGFSNPQIHVGTAIRARLQQLEEKPRGPH